MNKRDACAILRRQRCARPHWIFGLERTISSDLAVPISALCDKQEWTLGESGSEQNRAELHPACIFAKRDTAASFSSWRKLSVSTKPTRPRRRRAPTMATAAPANSLFLMPLRSYNLYPMRAQYCQQGDSFPRHRSSHHLPSGRCAASSAMQLSQTCHVAHFALRAGLWL